MKELRRIRKARGFTAQACADALEVSHSTWTRWESGYTEPSTEQRNVIADLLRVSLDQLAGRVRFEEPIAS